jgi:hypothetical protein
MLPVSLIFGRRGSPSLPALLARHVITTCPCLPWRCGEREHVKKPQVAKSFSRLLRQWRACRWEHSAKCLEGDFAGYDVSSYRGGSLPRAQ